jgi:DNA polymerase III delta subunit
MKEPVRFGVWWGDPFGVERALGQALAALGPREREVVFGDELSLGELLAHLGTPGLFSQERVLVVRRADPVAKSVRLAQALAGGPPPGLAVFFLGQDLQGPLAKVAQDARHFPPPSGRALRELARELLGRAGLPASSQLVELLVEACGGDALRLWREVEKLSLWAGERVSPSELAGLLFFAAPPPYGFLDALFGGQLPRAWRELRKLLASGWDPFRLFFLLVMQVRGLVAARAALEEGRSPSGPSWLAKRRLAQARRFTLPQLIELLERLQELDLKIKTGALSPQGALWSFTLSLAP